MYANALCEVYYFNHKAQLHEMPGKVNNSLCVQTMHVISGKCMCIFKQCTSHGFSTTIFILPVAFRDDGYNKSGSLKLGRKLIAKK
jgi:hypothetical protein